MAKPTKFINIKKSKNMAEQLQKLEDTEDSLSRVDDPEYYKQHAEEYMTGMNKEQAKQELEKRIAEKLANLSVADLDELLRYERDLEAERLAVEKKRQERQRRREQRKLEKEKELLAQAAQAKALKEGAEGALEEGAEAASDDLSGDIARREQVASEPAEAGTVVSETAAEDQAEQEDFKKGDFWPRKKSRKKEPLWDRITAAELPAGLMTVLTRFRDRIIEFCRENPERAAGIRRRFRIRKYKLISMRRRLAKREREMGVKMVALVNNMDSRNDEFAEKGAAAMETGSKRFNLAREWADLNKVLLLKYLSVFIIVAILGVAAFSQVTAFEYRYDGKKLGVVKNQEDVMKLVSLVSQQLTKRYGAEVNIDPEKDISFKRVISINKDIDSVEDILNRLTYMQDMNVRAWGVSVDGLKIAIVDKEETANDILRTLKADYIAENPADYLSVGFAENVEVKQIDTKLGNIMDSEEVREKILTGGESQKTHTVAAGDTFSGIAAQYGISQAELLETNPDVVPEKLHIGQEIILNETVPLLTVQTLEIASYIEYIPYETVYENDASMYKGDSKTVVAGISGERSVTSKIVRNNGDMMAILELSSQIDSQPTTEVIHVGTKDRPPTAGTGKFKYPVSGYRLTSKFGYRWGRMHYGLDLACSTGTPIKAADGGTVIFSGYSGSYGNVVKISHGNGYVTIYAHCSKLLVSSGTKVYQGQHIANVGNTGRSTGPHCHFEIQKNGVAVNPLKYL